MSALVVGLLLMAAAPVAAAAPHRSRTAAPGRSKIAVVYGDSLLWETKGDLVKYTRAQRAWKLEVRTSPATAPCDWLEQMRLDLARKHPTYLGIESVGASMTQCMIDPVTGAYFVYGSPAWANKYSADLDAFFSSVTATGALAVFIAGPPASWDGTVGAEPVLSIATREVVKYPGASVDIGPALAVTTNGIFTWTLPCMWTETAAEGCSLGQIVVRRSDGLHFCPGPWRYPGVWHCPVYSSGEQRFAVAIAASIESS